MHVRLIFLLFWVSPMVFSQGQKRKVLFLGNSYTQFNNLPGLVAAAAASVGDTLEFDFNYPGGYSLEQHFGNSVSINKIKAGNWDYVVLQDQSQRPALPEYSYAGAINLSSMIRKHNPCARPLFYMTWGRKNGDSQFCSSWPPVCSYQGMDSLLRLRYLEMAKMNHTEVSPVGATWKFIRQNYPNIELYNADESHPSLAGSYAAACSFYSSIFKKDPTLISYTGGLPANTASSIRLAAKAVVFDSLANWFFPADPPKALFGYFPVDSNNSIRFLNNSERADAYFWKFGDGDTSTLIRPSHTYLGNGSYTVTLTVSRCDLGAVFMDSTKKTIQFCPFTPTIFPDTTMLCTLNPDTLWTQNYDGYQWFNENGDSILNATNPYFIPISAGLHAVKTHLNGCAEMSRPAFVNAVSSFNFYYISPVSDDTICLGDTILLLLKPVTSLMPADKDIQWYQDGVPIPFSGNDTLKISAGGQYHAVVFDTLFCPGSPLFTTSTLPIIFQDCQVAITGSEVKDDISVFPNPGKNFVIRLSNWRVGSPYVLVDILGKAVRKGELHQEWNELEMEGLKDGLYLLQLNGQIFRLVKQWE